MVRIESLFSVDLFERFSVYVFQTHETKLYLRKICEMSSLERGRGHLYSTIFDWKSRYGTCEHVMNCYFHLQAHVRVFQNACFFNFALHQCVGRHFV